MKAAKLGPALGSGLMLIVRVGVTWPNQLIPGPGRQNVVRYHTRSARGAVRAGNNNLRSRRIEVVSIDGQGERSGGCCGRRDVLDRRTIGVYGQRRPIG